MQGEMLLRRFIIESLKNSNTGDMTPQGLLSLEAGLRHTKQWEKS